ncbi:MAG: flavin reductase family protein [Muribaculaceae bacterium]|jgi:flavin reductase (DIM6/NTAB) family NADH-FMN oxidoreductase RutF|nr:flavin reductase family protein [Muribaculaceae bacterium]
MKQNWRPGTMIYPLPAVMVSCGATPDEWNVMTASWVGTICSDPAMCYVSIRPERHSYEIIKRNMEFTLNLTTEELARATDWVGVRSGRDYNKFSEMHLTPVKGVKVSSPYIDECPMSIECRVKEIIHLGSHDMFIADVLNVIADDKYINKETGAFEMDKANMLAYVHGQYFGIGEKIGKFGWSVQKKK